MNYSTTYYPTNSTVLAKLTQHDRIRDMQTMLPFEVEVVDLFDALTNAYNQVIAQTSISGVATHDMESSIVGIAINSLRQRNAMAEGYAASVIRDYDTHGRYTTRPESTGRHKHRESMPTVVPRPANTLGLNTRHTYVPRSNKSLTPHELKQMRGIATSELSACII